MIAIDYPIFRLRNGEQYRLRFSLSAIKRMQEWEIGTDAPTNIDESWKHLAGQFAACACTLKVDEAGQPAVDENPTWAGLTPQVVRDMYFDEPDFAELRDMRAAVEAAVGFRRPAAGKTSQPAPAST